MEVDEYREGEKVAHIGPQQEKKDLRGWSRSLKNLLQCVHFIDEEIDSEI